MLLMLIVHFHRLFVNQILKFTDDTKIVSKVANDEQLKVLLSDLREMFE